mmetsp:Transcript_26921/g.96065  ORF Transcript_26921/g.96065 Transcript_26921/m.96065 type:complete len:135 (-) Transcript_26921:90-494(-)
MRRSQTISEPRRTAPRTLNSAYCQTIYISSTETQTFSSTTRSTSPHACVEPTRVRRKVVGVGMQVRSLGRNVRVDVWPRLWHDFVMYSEGCGGPGAVPLVEAGVALQRLASWITRGAVDGAEMQLAPPQTAADY